MVVEWDFQIKLNGYRIELEDVSQNLNKSKYIGLSSREYRVIIKITRCKISWPMTS